MWYATESLLSAPRRAGPQDLFPLNGRWLNQDDPFSLYEDANSDRYENAHLGPLHQRWRRDAFQPPEVLRDHLARDTCVHILRCISWLYCFLTTQGTEAYLPHTTGQE